MSSMPSRAQCLISFGSNLGDRDTVIAEAARKVVASPMVQGFVASRLFETPPIGGPSGQDPFLNAVGAFETSHSARDILGFLQSIEDELGRQRRRRWDARSIDLDVVLHGNLVGGSAALIVPHPRYTARQFVLQPACDVAAHYRDPRFGWTLGGLSAHLSAGNASLALVGGDDAIRQQLCDRLTSEHGIRTFAATQPTHSGVALGEAMSGRWKKNNRASDVPDVGQPSSAESPSTEPGEPIVVAGDEPWVSAYVPRLPIDPLSAMRSQFDSSPRPIPSQGLRSGTSGPGVSGPGVSGPGVSGPGVSGQEANDLKAYERQSTEATIPRLVARMQWATANTRWPAPHQMWPAGGRWPEYRLEIDNLDWAVTELASAIVSMRCSVRPVTEDGLWWQ